MKPETLEDAIGLIQIQFSNVQLIEWAMQPEEEAIIRAHFDLGLWIRNHWIRGEGSLLSDNIRRQSLFLIQIRSRRSFSSLYGEISMGDHASLSLNA